MIQTFKIVHEIDWVDRRVWFEFAEDGRERVTRLSGDPLHIKSKEEDSSLIVWFDNETTCQKKMSNLLAPLKANTHTWTLHQKD